MCIPEIESSHAQIRPKLGWWWVVCREQVACQHFTYSFVVEPEGEPGDDHNHEAGNVDGDDVEGELPGEHQVHPQAAVGPGGRGDVAPLVGGVRHLEASRKTQVGGKLEGSLTLPDIDQVIRRPTVCNVLFGLL